jgi:transcription termination factor NusB
MCFNRQKKTHHRDGLDGVFTMKKNKFRAELYKTYIASGLQDPVLIQEYIEIAESFVFYQKKTYKKSL